MELNGARALVAGGSGALGAAVARVLAANGARVVVAGRDRDRLAAVAAGLGTSPVVFDAVDSRACIAAVADAADQLGGLDLVVVTVGVAAFGPALAADPAVVDELFAVDVLGPMALVRAAAQHLTPGGTVAVFSAILADLPTARMAEYSAAKAALSTWLGVLRREERRRLRVLDVRPPHLDTALETRALAGNPPPLPAPVPAGEVVDAVIAALRTDAHELVWDADAKRLVARH